MCSIRCCRFWTTAALTDAQGRVVSFENTVIVMTSNAGSQSSGTPAGFGRTVSQMRKERVMKALEEIMRPEFLNRIDEIIAFNQLTEENFRHIAEIMLNELRGTLADKEHPPDVGRQPARVLTEKSYSVKYGARNLRRLIEKEIENPLANAIVTGDKPPHGRASLRRGRKGKTEYDLTIKTELQSRCASGFSLFLRETEPEFRAAFWCFPRRRHSCAGRIRFSQSTSRVRCPRVLRDGSA